MNPGLLFWEFCYGIVDLSCSYNPSSPSSAIFPQTLANTQQQASASVSIKSLSDENWARHLSMSTADYYQSSYIARHDWFYTMSLCYLPLVSDPPRSDGHRFHCMAWVSSWTRYWLVTSTMSMPSLTLYIMLAGQIVGKSFCGWFHLLNPPLVILPFLGVFWSLITRIRGFVALDTVSPITTSLSQSHPRQFSLLQVSILTQNSPLIPVVSLKYSFPPYYSHVITPVDIAQFTCNIYSIFPFQGYAGIPP